MLTIYKASAGSGKTYRLALYYLKMLLGVKDPETGKWRLNKALLGDRLSRAHRHILAITFTNKATEQMKSRIIESLDSLAQAQSPEGVKYVDELCRELNCGFDDLRKTARQAMVSILIDFGFFNVSTIDSFFQTVLRTFSRELGIQGDYNIEINTASIVRMALNMLLDDLEANRSEKASPELVRVRKWLNARASEKEGKYNAFDRSSSNYSDLVKMVDHIYREDFKSRKEELRNYLEDSSKLEAFRQALKDEKKKIPAQLVRAGHDAETDINASGQMSFISFYTKQFIEGLISGEVTLDNQSETMKRALKGQKVIGKNEYKLNRNGVVEGPYEAAIDRLFEKLQAINARSKTLDILLDICSQLEFIHLAINYIERVCADNNLLILDDTSTYISRIINGSEIPFIYEFLGTQLHHYLIDEFQDTSRMQWDNLLPLVKNSDASGDDCLIIGDTKQAIYRFRNSDASILGERLEKKDFPSAENRHIIGTQPEDNRNYRTAHGIVKFNNTILPLFAREALGTSDPRGFCGVEVQQLCAPGLAHLDAKIALFPWTAQERPAPKADDDNTSEHDSPSDDTSAQGASVPLLYGEEERNRKIIEEIRRQHDVENYAWSDIAILCRETKGEDNLLKMLIDEQIPLHSVDSLYLRNAQSVQLLVSLLRTVVMAGLPSAFKEEKAKAEDTDDNRPKKMDPVLFESRYHFFLAHGGPGGVPVTPAMALSMALDLDRETTVHSGTSTASVHNSLNDAIRSILHKHPATIVATIEAILAAGLIPNAIIEAEKDYIAAFTDLALDYGETKNNDINAFLEWWEQNKKKLAIGAPEKVNGVQFMTIHSAKGLEFKCVHLADFSWKLLDDRETAWLDIRPADEEHEQNKFGIDFQLDIPRDLYPPVACFTSNKKALEYIATPFRPYLDELYGFLRLDALNVAYVALTRPQHQLNVYFKSDSDGGDIFKTNVGTVLAEVLPQAVQMEVDSESDVYNLDIPAEAYDAGTGGLVLEVPASEPLTPERMKTMQIREAAARLEQEEKERQAKIYTRHYTSVFRTDVESIVNVPSLENNPEEEIDDPEEDVVAADDEATRLRQRQYQKSESTQRGLDLHEILSHIPVVPVDSDINLLLDKALERARTSGGFQTENEPEYRETVKRMLTHKDAVRWFDSHNRVDTEIAYFKPDRNADRDEDGVPDRHLVRRIDRLVELPDGGVEVVDYKFTADKSKGYISQIQEYMKDLAEIFPDRAISGYIWYVDLDEIVKIG